MMRIKTVGSFILFCSTITVPVKSSTIQVKVSATEAITDVRGRFSPRLEPINRIRTHIISKLFTITVGKCPVPNRISVRIFLTTALFTSKTFVNLLIQIGIDPIITL
uniref:Uncharacterized protein n=1 Tax=Arundo donax TaxID=35708 RepID=A0A0A9GWQ3_ARUDO